MAPSCSPSLSMQYARQLIISLPTPAIASQCIAANGDGQGSLLNLTSRLSQQSRRHGCPDSLSTLLLLMQPNRGTQFSASQNTACTFVLCCNGIVPDTRTALLLSGKYMYRVYPRPINIFFWVDFQLRCNHSCNTANIGVSLFLQKMTPSGTTLSLFIGNIVYCFFPEP